MLYDREHGVPEKLAFPYEKAVRRTDNPHDAATVWRNAFVRDVDKILHCPYYNRYADKTQVFSLRKNDDLSHRGLHVQLVSRIARTLSSALNLNVDLTEAIAVGHDLGHTPFGHTGERVLDGLYRENTGKRFSHNIHSVRVLENIFPANVTLQTLDGIAFHNGETELEKYQSVGGLTFGKFDEQIKGCYENAEYCKNLLPSTLEGCVVRISDIIAYLGKDRHDAEKSGVNLKPFVDYGIGTTNAEIINNLSVNVIENSYGKPYIMTDEAAFRALALCKKENYDNIYLNPLVKDNDEKIKSMMSMIYDRLLSDLKKGVKSSPVFTHHIEYLEKPYYKRIAPYAETQPDRIVTDYIASMTDDYFIDLFGYLFPDSGLYVSYKGYFE